ncbi:GAF domain-containing sensor histidine kinase [Chitinimonas lacunae]|uniref:histidine kinase n=1 Tax=Chitinimonas lacunae TaxID=1963018 RepID=A0ABV8MNB6_9NEIS
MSDSMLLQKALLAIAQETSVGQVYFDFMTRALCEQLAVRYALVGLVSEDQFHVETVSLCVDGQLVPNMRYELAHTPCESVYGKCMCIYPQGVADLFPKDTLLREMGVESYLGAPIFDTGGHAIGLVVLLDDKAFIDTSERRTVVQVYAARAGAEIDRMRFENSLRTLNHRLEAEVEARTRDLLNANRQLDNFSHSVAHDLRAPLRHMSSFCELLLELPEVAGSAEASRCANIIIKSSRKMASMIESVLEFSRLARAEPHAQTLDAALMIAEVAEEARSVLEGRPCELSLPQQGTLYGDPMLLRMALANLIGNAFKYSRLRDTVKVQVTLELLPDGFVRLSVRDNGVGFEMNQADKLFGLFQRLHESSRFEGHGVGLANVRNIVVRHGGRVGCEAAPDQGACFWIELPGEAA